MRTVPIALGALALVLGAAWVTSRPSRAIPAFARQYDYSCTTCHAPFPRLKAFGEEFAANGFAPSDEEAPPRYFTDVGDDRLSLLRVFPLAVRADLHADATLGGTGLDGSNDFKTPWGMKLLSGGRLAEHASYYFYFFMSEDGQVVGLEDALLFFNDVLGTLDITVGQFQLSDPIFKRETRLTLADYLPFKLRPGQSATDLTYDRGVVLSYDLEFGLGLVASITNGTGIGAAVGDSFDLDRYKHFLLRASQDLGPLRLGLTGVYAKEALPVGSGTGAYVGVNELHLVGPDLTLGLGRVELNALYLLRRDKNADLGPAYERGWRVSHGLMAELIADLYRERLYGVLLANWIASDQTALDQQAYTANLTWLGRTNIKALAEYTFAPVKDGARVDEHRLSLGVSAGF